MRPVHSSGHNPISSSVFTEIDIPFVVGVIYWSLPTSGSPQEIAWNGPKLVYDCVVWVGAVMALILCPPLFGIYIKLICIVFMESLLESGNSLLQASVGAADRRLCAWIDTSNVIVCTKHNRETCQGCVYSHGQKVMRVVKCWWASEAALEPKELRWISCVQRSAMEWVLTDC